MRARLSAWWWRLTPAQQWGRATTAGTILAALLLAGLLPLLGGPWR